MQTCLVIDEFSVVRKIAARILGMAGYTVHSAETCGEALAVLAKVGTVDVVILSATLPEQPIEDAIRKIQSHPAARNAVVLASLVEANLGTMTRAKRAGARGFVYRPFDRTAMLDWLKAYAPSPVRAIA